MHSIAASVTHRRTLHLEAIHCTRLLYIFPLPQTYRVPLYLCRQLLPPKCTIPSQLVSDMFCQNNNNSISRCDPTPEVYHFLVSLYLYRFFCINISSMKYLSGCCKPQKNRLNHTKTHVCFYPCNERNTA